MTRIVLLGPQRFHPNVREAIDSLGAEGPVAVISAGWQEREAEDQELKDHLAREVVDLTLYRRYDDVLLRDRELALALRERQANLRQFQDLYRLRLDHTLAPARELMRRQAAGAALEAHRRGAIRALRTLDRNHLRRLRGIHDGFVERWQPASRPIVARHREQLARELQRCAVLAIAGGNVTVLLNRMRLFELPPLLGDKPVVAWSAGAMAVSERIVLFHDSPPQGPGNPEVLDAGLDFYRELLPLPHARRRLRLDDPVRVALFARRFLPATCVALEQGSRVDWDGERWVAVPGTVRLGPRGRLRSMESA